jgi:hypothetical protein
MPHGKLYTTLIHTMMTLSIATGRAIIGNEWLLPKRTFS